MNRSPLARSDLRALVFALVASVVLGACQRAQPAPSPTPAPTPTAPAKRDVPAQPQTAAPSPIAQHGAELYARTCAVCHGADGEGYRADRAPALHRNDFLGAVSDDFLRRAIADGRRGSTMSAWSARRGGPFKASDIDALIAFLRTWQRGPRPALDERPPFGDPLRGASVYARECANCHGALGTGGPYVQIGNRELLVTATTGMLRDAIRHGRPGTPMPSFDASLGEQAIEDVIAHVRDTAARNAPPLDEARERLNAPLPLGKVPLNPSGPPPRGFLPLPKLTPADVVHRELARRAKLALLDARAPSDYVNEHIAGAVSVPFYDPAPYLDRLPKNAWLVCYCSCPLAESGALANKLRAAGFDKVTVLAEGLPYWKKMNYATRSGVKP
jgi:cytochrome c oxidase cbb3-type subunit 3/ubiquinol-cytochrome c reductase cytochrome c subunit